MGATEEHFEQIAAYEASVMKDMDAYIGLRSGDNINEQADVPSERMQIHGQTVGKKVHRDIRVPKTRWVVLRYRLLWRNLQNEHRSFRRLLLRSL